MPPAQSVHDDCPELASYLPAAQSVQLETAPAEIVPAAQSLQAEAADAEYWPGAQLAVLSVRPVVEQYDPAGHAVHEL